MRIDFCDYVNLIVVSLTLLFLLPNVVSGTNSLNEVNPRNIEIEVGSSANVTCRMDLMSELLRGRDSSSLYFVDANDEQQRVPMSDIAIVDNSTIVYMLRHATAQKKMYRCHSGEYAIDIVNISVGTRPLDATDFKCRSYDYSYMICNFTKPFNNLATQYNLTYTAHNPNYMYVCQLEMQSTFGLCNLTNNYRATYECFNFTLTANNNAGTNVQTFWINNFQSVIPARPNCTVEQIRNHSAVLRWTINSFISGNNLQYEVRLRADDCEWQNFRNFTINYNSKKSQLKLKLHHLMYAYYWYDVSLRIKISNAKEDDTLWSEPAVQRFRTAASPPPAPPTTEVGSFYIGSSQQESSVRLYWRQLSIFQQNGPNFHYEVAQVKRDGEPIELSCLKNDSTSATFPWEREYRYEFWIISRNDKGASRRSSRLVVPAMRRAEQISPRWIRSVYHGGNRTYTVSWSPPDDVDGLQNYTVYWCPSLANTNECKGSIDFKNLTKNVNYLNTEPQNIDQALSFAVSANYLEYNSGMHWTLCSTKDSSELEQMNPDVTTPLKREMKLQWSTDRVCNVEGYNLTYCPVDRKGVCVGERYTTVVVEKTAKQYILKGLQPFTTYKIQINMFSKLKTGTVSEAQWITTKQEAPSPPRNLKHYNITSNSAYISWQPPLEFNGILTHYTIVQNNEHHIVNCSTLLTCRSVQNQDENDNAEIVYKLEHLSSYRNYKVYVLAHTVETSQRSNYLQFQTLVGRPSNPRHLILSEQGVMQWTAPELPAGRVEFYEVRVTVWYKDTILYKHISPVVAATNCSLNIPVCASENYKYTFDGRAVNAATRETEIDTQLLESKSVGLDGSEPMYYGGHDELQCVSVSVPSETAAPRSALLADYSNISHFVLYRSAWEKGPTYGCVAASAINYKLIFIAVGFAILLMVLLISRYGYIKYRKMVDIVCTLPDGLNVAPLQTPDTGGDDNSDLEKKKASLFLWHNEHHRLLSGVGNDSGYMDCGTDLHKGGGDVQTPCSIGKSSGYFGSDRSEISEEHTLPVAQDAYMAMELLYEDRKGQKSKQNKEVQNTSTGGNTTHVTIVNGYVHPSVAKHVFMEEKVQATFMPALSKEICYVKPNAMSWQPQRLAGVGNAVCSNGTQFPKSNNDYVAPNLLQKPALPSWDDYTTLNVLGKPKDQHPAASVNTVGKGVSPTISGYVTHNRIS